MHRPGRSAWPAPLVQVNLVTTLDKRRADIRLRAQQPRAGDRRRGPGRSRPEPLPGSARSPRGCSSPARSRPISAAATSGSPWSSTAPFAHARRRLRSARRAASTFGGDDDRGPARGRQRPGPRRRHRRPGLGAGEPDPRLRRGRRRHRSPTSGSTASSASPAPGWSPTICCSARTGSTPRLALAFDLAARPLSRRASRAG